MVQMAVDGQPWRGYFAARAAVLEIVEHIARLTKALSSAGARRTTASTFRWRAATVPTGFTPTALILRTMHPVQRRRSTH
jgi:hypothetical protein